MKAHIFYHPNIIQFCTLRIKLQLLYLKFLEKKVFSSGSIYIHATVSAWDAPLSALKSSELYNHNTNTINLIIISPSLKNISRSLLLLSIMACCLPFLTTYVFLPNFYQDGISIVDSKSYAWFIHHYIPKVWYTFSIQKVFVQKNKEKEKPVDGKRMKPIKEIPKNEKWKSISCLTNSLILLLLGSFP